MTTLDPKYGYSLEDYMKLYNSTKGQNGDLVGTLTPSDWSWTNPYTPNSYDPTNELNPLGAPTPANFRYEMYDSEGAPFRDNAAFANANGGATYDQYITDRRKNATEVSSTGFWVMAAAIVATAGMAAGAAAAGAAESAAAAGAADGGLSAGMAAGATAAETGAAGGLAGAAGAGAAGGGAAGTAAGLGTLGSATMPVVTIGAPAATVGGLGAAGTAAAAGAGGLAAAAGLEAGGAGAGNVPASQPTPQPSLEQTVQPDIPSVTITGQAPTMSTPVLEGLAGASGVLSGVDASFGGTTPTDIVNSGAVDTSGVKSSEPGGLTTKDYIDLVKQITNLGSAFNDKNSNQNTANNANGQLSAILNEAKSQQGKQDEYLKTLTGLAADNTKANSGYVNTLNGISDTIGKNNADYLAMMNGYVVNNNQSSADYVNTIKGRASASDSADDAYVSQLMGMYKPGTAEATLMENKMNAKDAAAGRNSQYGVRAVDLAQQLAAQRAQIMLNSNYVNAMHHSNGSSLLSSQGYLDAMYNKPSTDLLNSSNYQNSMNGTAQTNLLTNSAYTNALGNKSATDILTGPAYAGTVNNNPLLNALSSSTNVGLNSTATNATNNQNNSLWATAGSAANSLGSLWNTGSKIWSGLSSFF